MSVESPVSPEQFKAAQDPRGTGVSIRTTAPVQRDQTARIARTESEQAALWRAYQQERAMTRDLLEDRADAEEAAFRVAHEGLMSSDVLMSDGNPNGWQLEELLVKLRAEINAKLILIERDPSDAARALAWNNRMIMALLFDAEGIQRESIEALRRLGPNQGPRGMPRIGLGSV